MAEAQRLIGISLAKIAQSRVCRGGVSLHKNLLVATVLQKARYIFMEEAYHYFQQNKCFEMEMEKQKNSFHNNNNNNNDSDDSSSESEENDDNDDTFPIKSDESDVSNDKKGDKENKFPIATTTVSNNSKTPSSNGPVYHDLDAKQDQREPQPPNSNKRRREIAEWETEEAVLSILPKRVKSDEEEEEGDEEEEKNKEVTDYQEEQQSATTSTFLEEATALSEAVAKEIMEQEEQEQNEMAHSPSVESIDRITSLVSIFSFGNLTRSMSTPDFCAAQAKESDGSITLQHGPRTFLTMTV